MDTRIFDRLYGELNERQREAVDTIEGPVMVVAGPGTGKTQVLTLRIANILRVADVDPRNIVALTFTEAAARGMRRRLAEIIGTPAYSVVITTFHSFCNDIIGQYPEDFPHIIGSLPITEVEQVKVVEEVVDLLPLTALKPFGSPFHYVRAIVSAISALKREGVTPARFAELVEQEHILFEKKKDELTKTERGRRERLLAKNKELVGVYRHYHKRLGEIQGYDYNDMIMEALGALSKNQNLLRALQEEYQYVLVDEHQDTNNAQNSVLKLLCGFHANPNIFVVGDEKQAIFRFQGASLENFLYFKNLYPEARMVALRDNYRSAQPILDVAHGVLAGKEPLVGKTGHTPEKMALYVFPRVDEERYFLAEHIKERIGGGVLPHEIAVLYRDNADAFPIAEMLEKREIPYRIESDQNVLGDHEIRKLLLLLRGVEEFTPDRLIAALHVDFLGVAPLSIYRAGSSVGALISLYPQLSSWRTLSRNTDLVQFLETVVRESGMLARIMGLPNAYDALGALTKLFDEARQVVRRSRNSLSAFLAHIDALEEHGLLLRRSSVVPDGGHVRLMTAHRSKGLEFDYVYVAGCSDGKWGGRRRPELLPLLERVYSRAGERGSTDDDEKRLFYVALTRARKGVVISYAKGREDGREQLASRFISYITPDLLREGDAGGYVTRLARSREVLFAPRGRARVSLGDRAFVREQFLRRGLSVTALNNYLVCPWKYFYVNLLRIPKAPSRHQMYGIAVHGALRDLFSSRERTKPDLMARFAYHVGQQPLMEADALVVRGRGKEALGGWFDAYSGAWDRRVLTEVNVGGVELSPGVRLTGRLDKLELLDDGTRVNVVDYKTGKPKSRNVIEGKTKNSEGDIGRQLVFYKLLLDRYLGGRYRMVSGEVDFVEPDPGGRYRKERFEIAPSEAGELEELVRSVADEIIGVRFWDRRCDAKNCEFCALREVMRV